MARSKFEILCDKELKEKGWFVDYKARPSFMIKGYNTDYWNLFDILAHKDGKIKMISVKPASNCPVSHQEDIRNFKVSKGISKQIWKYDRNPKDRRKIRRRILEID